MDDLINQIKAGNLVYKTDTQKINVSNLLDAFHRDMIRYASLYEQMLCSIIIKSSTESTELMTEIRKIENTWGLNARKNN